MARIEQVISGEEPVWKYLLDILGHAGLGAAWSIFPIAFVVWFGLGGFWVSVAVGEPFALAGAAVREWWQWRKTGYDPDKVHLKDRVWDTIHHVLGPPIAYPLAVLALYFVMR